MITTLIVSLLALSLVLMIVLLSLILILEKKFKVHTVQIESLFKIAGSSNEVEKVFALTELRENLEKLKTEFKIKK